MERGPIRPHPRGKSEVWWVATAYSPAMLFYLDNWMSSSPEPNFPKRFERRRPARFGRGFYGPGMGQGRPGPYSQGMMRGGLLERRRDRRAEMLARQGAKKPGKRPQRGINENYGRELMELHTLGVNGGYTQQDVIEVARCLTGWTIRRPRYEAEFFFNPRMHDYHPKLVLGHKFPAGRGIEDGQEVLHLLAHHP